MAIAYDEESTTELIRKVRAEAGPALVDSRRAAEDGARALLDETAGRMSEEQADGLLRHLNTGAWGGAERYNRFSPAFVGNLRNLMLRDLQVFNDWTGRLWADDVEVALQAADSMIRDPQALPGAGRSYPSALLYLRDSEQYAVCMSGTERGLALLTDYEPSPRGLGIEGYLTFCDAARSFRARHGLAPQELDAVLSHVPRAELAPARASSRPTVPPDAFTFLKELVENNNKAWMDTNRARYKAHLRRPFREVLEAVASEYMVDIDPELETDVKQGKVLASIRRRWPGEDGEYQQHYWGAFCRGRKQEDVQLYLIIFPDLLEFGLSFISAPEEAVARFHRYVEGDPDAAWRVLEPLAPRLAFADAAEEDRTSSDHMSIHSADELKAWSQAVGRPSISVRLDPTNELIGSPELVDEIGRTLSALHPLARVAWGEKPRTDLANDVHDEDDTSLAEPYGLDDVAAETFIDIDLLEEWITLLEEPSRRQALFYGPPGTGKTYVAQRLARHLAGEQGTAQTVQFHPSFSYEDLVEGLRPVAGDGQITYEVRPGLFTSFCERARGQPGEHVFVIDEINRADLGATLGELMMLLEYRGESIRLPYSQKQFSVPRNVIVLATMNTADRSLALVDFALRRRFHAIEMAPSESVLSGFLQARDEPQPLALEFFRIVRNAVDDDELAPGHSYWMVNDLTGDGLLRVWRYQLRPYLVEYWHDQRQRLQALEDEISTLLA